MYWYCMQHLPILFVWLVICDRLWTFVYWYRIVCIKIVCVTTLADHLFTTLADHLFTTLADHFRIVCVNVLSYSCANYIFKNNMLPRHWMVILWVVGCCCIPSFNNSFFLPWNIGLKCVLNDVPFVKYYPVRIFYIFTKAINITSVTIMFT